MNIQAFNKENPVDLFSQLIKVLSRHKQIDEQMNKIREISKEIFSKLEKTSKKIDDIILENGVFYLIVDNIKMPIDIDAPPQFRASLKIAPKNKPSIFKKTIYRLPTEEELDEVHSFKLSSDKLLDGFCYTIIGRGILSQDNKNKIISSIKMLCSMHPKNIEYKNALSKAHELKIKLFS